ncbi:phage tail sheath protein FI [Pantoea agglomerans]|uniref:phage tail sheath family protein n=1 Tax=Enterobacter agglomerans TaxID=549 RepID=UPI0013BBF9E6|nr:phage tail sheath family protein [Pantoea agglomerans]MDQ0430968.1 phage tail sheath protein FI [Pantoea agglomerans]NEG84928.1 phage tail sheath family protein [Pantoea agglomerans]NEH06701.1 phage tail sheath family protein [Pantoea agglomerans]
MTMVLPGVSYDETLLTQASVDDPVTMPLFIGYTLADVTIQSTAMQPVSVSSLTQTLALFGQRGTLAYSLRHFFENGGRQCYVLSLGPSQGEPAARLQALIAALQAPQMLETLLADDKTGLVLVPEMSELNEIDRFGVAETADVDVDALWYQGWQALLTMCHQAPQRFALLELPDSPAHAVTLTGQSFSADLCQRGAAWWPRLETSYEDEALAPVVLSPLPAVAAAIQRSAHINGVWKAPAKISLAKTLRPTQSILTSQALLKNRGVSWNLIRSFVGKGVRLWGCRTLLNEENTDWSYIQTRLLVSSVENYLCKLARAYLFEPNTALTWMKLKGQVWTWLRQQWLAGAFFGTVEDEAFSLRIGLDETMTEDDIRQGKMILQVGLALLAPAEFVAISLTLELRDSTARSQIGG